MTLQFNTEWPQYQVFGTNVKYPDGEARNSRSLYLLQWPTKTSSLGVNPTSDADLIGHRGHEASHFYVKTPPDNLSHGLFLPDEKKPLKRANPE